MADYEYMVARCVLGRGCKKCNSIADPIAVKRGPHLSLYCINCGAYIKHASIDDKHHLYATRVKVEDMTPMAVCSLYTESEKTMFPNYITR